MKSLVLVGLVTAVHGATRMLDEEEFLHAKQFRDEALEVEREVARMALETGEGYHYVEPAPLSEGYHYVEPAPPSEGRPVEPSGCDS